jgi:hypothetical protein
MTNGHVKRSIANNNQFFTTKIKTMNRNSIAAALMRNQSMESIVDYNYIQQIVSKQWFCAYSKPQVILDMRTAIVIEVYKDNKMVKVFAISPTLADRLEVLKKTLGEVGSKVRFLTNNKRVQVPESSYKEPETESI